MIAEMGVGQFETNLHHQADPVLAAISGDAQAHPARYGARAGLGRHLHGKALCEDVGSGMHVHISLTDSGGRNLFGEEGRGERALRHCIAGCKRHAGSPRLLCAEPQFLPPLRRAVRAGEPQMGEDNRTVALRIPTDRGPGRRIEHRVCGADANPYLAMAAMLAGMHHGLVEKLERTPPWSASTLASRRIPACRAMSSRRPGAWKAPRC